MGRINGIAPKRAAHKTTQLIHQENGNASEKDRKNPEKVVPMLAARSQHGSTTKFLFCAIGILLSFFVFGIFQERITRGAYGQERFHYTLSLVFVQCVINAIFAQTMIRITREPPDTTPRSWYGLCSLSYLAAMLFSHQALQYVSYPTQVLGKSCKPIPVMIFGVLFAHRHYPIKKYMFVFAIVLGVGIFFYESGKQNSNEERKEVGFGRLLLVLSLLMDGVTGTIQDRARSAHKTRPNSMMMWMNAFAALVMLSAIVFTGELMEVIHFATRHPIVIEQVLTFATCGAVGQYFIYLTVTEFGSLPCSIVTTTRKFFTILASVIFFNNPISSWQWLATLLVFTGLILDVKYGKDRKH